MSEGKTAAADRYVLQRGEDGAARLRLLSRVKGPSTMALLRRAGLRPGLRCLDVGCGIGEVALAMARHVGPTGAVTGLDLDAGFVAGARAEAVRRGLAVDFQVGDARALDVEAVYDLVFARYLLSHLAAPEAVLACLARAVALDGVLVVEDVDFPGHVCFPPNAAFDRYVALYQGVVLANGGDPVLGPRLGALLRGAGLTQVRMAVAQPAFTDGPGKRLAAVTLTHVRDGIVRAGLATADEVDATVAALEAQAKDPNTLHTLARTFQAWGRRPGKAAEAMSPVADSSR